MEKKHVSPEFVVIKQNEANAKFFVASSGGSFEGSDGASTGQNYGNGDTFGNNGDDPNDPVW